MENGFKSILTYPRQESATPWATRWDNYLHIFDPVGVLALLALFVQLMDSPLQRIHWFSLINSIIVVVFLCLMVSMILLRTVSRDVSMPRRPACLSKLIAI